MASSTLIDALDSVASLLSSNDEPRRSIDDGRFYLRFLGQDHGHDNDGAWALIRERIETVFGPNLLQWSQIGKEEHRSRRCSELVKRRQSVRDKPRPFLNFFHDEDDDLEDYKFYAKVALLTLYISAVHDQQEHLWGTLTTNLTTPQQNKIQSAFEILLDNRRTMTSAKLDALFTSFSPVSSSGSSNFSTPYRATPSVSSLGESYIYSPTTSNSSPAASNPNVQSPLQTFLKAQQTKQMIEKLQKELREASSRLEQEKSEANYLKRENQELVSERDHLKQDLEVTKGKLFTNSNRQHSVVSQSDVTEYESRCEKLHAKIAELKDSNKYMKNLEAQLEAAVQDNRELNTKFEAAKEKVTERETKNALLEHKVTDFQLKLVAGENQNQRLKEAVDDLQKQVRELQDINSHHGSQSEIGGFFSSNHRQSEAFDISMDNPQNILSPPRGETLGDAVVLNLQDEIATMKGQMEQMDQALKSEQLNVSQLQISLNGANSQLKSSKEEMVVQKKAFDQKVSELLQKTEKSYVEVAKLKEVLDQTTMEKNEASHKVETLEKDAQFVQEENDSLKAALQTKDNAYRLLQQTVQSQSEIEVEAKQKIESLESDIQSLQNETVNLKAALQSEKSTILELQSNLTEANTQVNDLKKTSVLNKETFNSELTNLHQMLEESTVEKESFREKLMQLEREKASFQSIIEGKDSDCKVLQKRLEDKTDGEEQAMQKVQLLESDIQSMNHNTDNLKSALQSEKVTVLELQRSLAETKTQLKLTKENAQENEETINEEVTNLKRTLEETLSAKESLEEKLEKEKKSFQSIIEEKDSAYDQLQQQFYAQSEVFQGTNHKVEVLEKDIQNLQLGTDKLKAALQSEKVTVLEFQSYLSDAKSQVKDLKEELLAQTESFDIKVADLKQSLQQSTMAHDSIDEKMRLLQQENERFQAIIEEKDNTHKSLQKSLENQFVVEAETKQKVGLLETDIQSLQNETVNLKAGLQSERVAVLELQSSLAVAKAEQKDSEDKRNALTLDALNMKQGLEQALAEKDSLSEELRNLKETLEQSQKEKESTLELLETERKCSQMNMLERETAVKKTVEQQIELAQLKEKNMLLQNENASMQKSISEKDMANNVLQKELQDKSEVDHEGQKQEELQAQKKRYEAKVREIHDTLTTKYKAKVEECIGKWKVDIEDKEKKHKEEQLFMEKQINDYKKFAKNSEDKYSMAKKKMEDVVSKMDEVASALKVSEAENSKLKKLLTIAEVKIAELESKPSSDKLHYENQQLQKEIKRLKCESRSLQVQCSAADTKLRELQKQTSKSASNLSLKSNKKDSEGFTMPMSTKHTPGRTRASRTQSEVTMPRRPPQGSGAIFKMDEEDGEMFSSSYLTDLKAGVCTVNNGNGHRISELARRNTMQPAHLKSSYPAETQFRPATEFTDDDLRLGKIQQSFSNMSVDSPAMNTRRQSSVRLSISDGLRSIASRKPVLLETPPQPSGLRPRKRPSMTTSHQEEVENNVVKKPRKELSYSKPGPPTPARKHNRSANSSLNTSGKSNQSIITAGSSSVAFETPAKAHDRTPLLDSTNKSNRSLRSLKTPASLKKMMTRAFRKDKDKYKVKKSLNTPLRNM